MVLASMAMQNGLVTSTHGEKVKSIAITLTASNRQKLQQISPPSPPKPFQEAKTSLQPQKTIATAIS
jgi:hypothetical protein